MCERFHGEGGFTMNLLANAMADLEAALLPMAAALLLEELTYGGLVRLLLARRPQTRETERAQNRNGGGKCSH
jgi:hypothetical protein